MRRFGMPFALTLPLVALVVVPVAGLDEPLPPIKRPIRPPVGRPVTAESPLLNDADALKTVGLNETDAAPLLDYFKQRTLTDADQSKIGEVIKRFGADSFDDRLKAMEEVEKFGSAAIGPLKSAEKDSDAEVAYRARATLKRMEKVPHATIASAATRAIVKLKHKEAATVLLAFLPMADNDEVAEEIRTGLISLAVIDGKPEPALLKALDDKSVARRAAAYVALIEGGPVGERIRIKDAFPLVKAAVQKETDIDAKFRGLWAMMLTSREKEFVAELIELIPKLPRGRIWQLEEFLLLAAGKDKPEARFGRSEDSLVKAKDAWAAWWKKKTDGFDLAKFEFKPRITGYTDIIEYDVNGYGRYRVVTLGPDQQEKAKITGANNQLQYPSDVKKLPNGNYLIAEQNGSRLTERDSSGRVVKNTSITQPIGIELLPEGGMIVICRNQVVQYDKDMKTVWTHNRQQYDIIGGKRLANGDIVYISQFRGDNNPNTHTIAAKDGKLVGKGVNFGQFQQVQGIDVVGDDKVIACEYNRVVEYDLKTGKQVWAHNINNPTSCQRLPNGNTLVSVMYYNNTNSGRVIEIDPSGEIVWEYESKDGLRPARAIRR
jgi:outer membrane protein assembly factor BamB